MRSSIGLARRLGGPIRSGHAHARWNGLPAPTYQSMLLSSGASRSGGDTIIDASDPESTFTEKTPITIQLWRKRQAHVHKERESASFKENSSHGAAEKDVQHSRTDVHYNLRTDKSLRHIYRDSGGSLLLERFLEDLDALAGNVAFFHCDDGIPATSPLALVTASVEEIDVLRTISARDDIILSGQVVWVGKSSLDVLVEAHQYSSPPCDGPRPPPALLDPSLASSTRVLSSVFTYVAKDRKTGKAAVVNPLRLESLNAHERAFYDQRDSAAKSRKATAAAGGAGTDTTDPAVRDFMIKLVDCGKANIDMPALASGNGVLMSATALENSFVCQPQKTNTAGNVFGGYLIHEAYTLAQASMYMFCGRPASLSHVNKIVFRKAVHIGDLIRLRSRIVYAQGDDANSGADSEAAGTDGSLKRRSGRRAICDITCHVVKPEDVSSVLSNRFSFVFSLDEAPLVPVSVPATPVAAPVSRQKRTKVILPSTKEEVISLYEAASGVLGLSLAQIKADYSPAP